MAANDIPDTRIRYAVAHAGIRGQSIRREVAALRRGLDLGRKRGAVARILRDWPTVASDPPSERRRGHLVEPADLARWFVALLELERTSPSTAGAHGQAVVAIMTGLRAAELRLACASWVAWSGPPDGPWRAVLRLPSADTKGKRERFVGLPPAALEAVWTAAACTLSDDLPLWPKAHRRAHRLAARAAGLSRAPTLRDLRHTHSTLGLAGTGDAAGVQAAMGHSDLRTTQRYQSATVARVLAVSESVSAAVSAAQSRHREVGTGGGVIRGFSAAKVVEATGIEPATSCLQSTPVEDYRHSKHIDVCAECRALVEDCIASHSLAGTDPGTARRAAG